MNKRIGNDDCDLSQGGGDADNSYCALIRECLQSCDQANGDKDCEFHKQRIILKCQEHFRKVSAWGELRMVNKTIISEFRNNIKPYFFKFE